jgi:hypothetical protein
MPTETVEFSFELIIWAFLGIILMTCIFNVASAKLDSNRTLGMKFIAYYIVQNVNIAASRNIRLSIKLPCDINGLPYCVYASGKTVVIQADNLEASKETLFPMVSKTFSSGKCYLIIPQDGIVFFQGNELE